MVHEHGDDAELVRLEAAAHRIVRRAGPRELHELPGGRGRRGERAHSRQRRVPAQRAARVRDRRIPEQVLVEACCEGGVDLRPHLALPVLDAEGEVLEPRHNACSRPAHRSLEVEQRPAHDCVGPPLRVADPVLVRAPVGRVEHRCHVVDLAGDGGHVLRDLVGPRGRDAEHRCAEEGLVRSEVATRPRQEADDCVRGIAS